MEIILSTPETTVWGFLFFYFFLWSKICPLWSCLKWYLLQIWLAVLQEPAVGQPVPRSVLMMSLWIFHLLPFILLVFWLWNLDICVVGCWDLVWGQTKMLLECESLEVFWILLFLKGREGGDWNCGKELVSSLVWGPSHFCLPNPSLKSCFAMKMFCPLLKPAVSII